MSAISRATSTFKALSASSRMGARSLIAACLPASPGVVQGELVLGAAEVEVVVAYHNRLSRLHATGREGPRPDLPVRRGRVPRAASEVCAEELPSSHCERELDGCAGTKVR